MYLTEEPGTAMDDRARAWRAIIGVTLVFWATVGVIAWGVL